MRDSQRSKVYSWENAHLRPTDAKEKLDFTAIQVIAEQAAFLFGYTVPEIEAKHHGSATAHWGSLVRLPGWARVRSVVLHEVAHCLTHGILQNLGKLGTEASHGPTFVRVYFELATRLIPGLQPAALRKTLAAARIKIGPAGLATTLTRGEQKEFRRILAAQVKLKERRADLARIGREIDAEERLLTTSRSLLTSRVKDARKAATNRAAIARQEKAARARARWQQRQQEAATIQGGQA
jgi:hypothetical protein